MQLFINSFDTVSSFQSFKYAIFPSSCLTLNLRSHYLMMLLKNLYALFLLHEFVCLTSSPERRLNTTEYRKAQFSARRLMVPLSLDVGLGLPVLTLAFDQARPPAFELRSRLPRTCKQLLVISVVYSSGW